MAASSREQAHTALSVLAEVDDFVQCPIFSWRQLCSNLIPVADGKTYVSRESSTAVQITAAPPVKNTRPSSKGMSNIANISADAAGGITMNVNATEIRIRFQ